MALQGREEAEYPLAVIHWASLAHGHDSALISPLWTSPSSEEPGGGSCIPGVCICHG